MPDRLSDNTRALHERAALSEAACTLLDGAPSEVLFSALIDSAAEGDWLQLPERARWNLLWVWAELSADVDVYRARVLWNALAGLFARQLHQLDDSPAVQMVFDFFFRRPSHPLIPAQLASVLALLGSLLGVSSKALQRSALVGLGRVLRLLGPSDAQAPVLALLDRFIQSAPATLAPYARAVRQGEVD